MSVMNF